MKSILFKSILLIAIFVSCSTKEKKQAVVEQQTPAPQEINELPAMPITLLDGQATNAKTLSGKIIIVLFQPDCDHCQHEAEEIKQRIGEFKDYKLYFVSSASIDEISKFAVDYKLFKEENVIFGRTESANILNNFGSIQAPSIYIYSSGKMITYFNGQTPVEEIIAVL